MEDLMIRLLRVLLPLLVWSGHPSPSFASDKTLETFDACWDLVRRKFYDKELHGVDWNRIRDHYRPQADEADEGAELHAVMRRMLAELGASHTTLLSSSVFRGMMAELKNQLYTTYGVLLEETLPGRYFVRGLFESGPGEDAGLLVGDRVVEINGIDIEASPLCLDAGYDPGLRGQRMFFLGVDASERIELLIQRDADSRSRRTVQLRARSTNAVQAAEKSVRVVEQDGVRIGRMHLWFCSQGVARALTEACLGPLSGCDVLLLDLRGRGGYESVVKDILGVFESSTHLSLQGVRREPPVWGKPVVFLLDDRSRSAKELLAYYIRERKIGTIVGQRTEGAVLGAMFYKLPDGSYLELAGMQVPANGKILEGVGVPPHIEVDFPLAYARGEDPIAIRGLEAAVREVRRHRLRGKQAY